jgi:hypothetical protein
MDSVVLQQLALWSATSRGLYRCTRPGSSCHGRWPCNSWQQLLVLHHQSREMLPAPLSRSGRVCGEGAVFLWPGLVCL